MNNEQCIVHYKHCLHAQTCEIKVYNKLRPNLLSFILEEGEVADFDIDRDLKTF